MIQKAFLKGFPLLATWQISINSLKLNWEITSFRKYLGLFLCTISALMYYVWYYAFSHHITIILFLILSSYQMVGFGGQRCYPMSFFLRYLAPCHPYHLLKSHLLVFVHLFFNTVPSLVSYTVLGIGTRFLLLWYILLGRQTINK